MCCTLTAAVVFTPKLGGCYDCILYSILVPQQLCFPLVSTFVERAQNPLVQLAFSQSQRRTGLVCDCVNVTVVDITCLSVCALPPYLSNRLNHHIVCALGLLIHLLAQRVKVSCDISGIVLFNFIFIVQHFCTCGSFVVVVSDPMGNNMFSD